MIQTWPQFFQPSQSQSTLSFTQLSHLFTRHSLIPNETAAAFTSKVLFSVHFLIPFLAWILLYFHWTQWQIQERERICKQRWVTRETFTSPLTLRECEAWEKKEPLPEALFSEAGGSVSREPLGHFREGKKVKGSFIKEAETERNQWVLVCTQNERIGRGWFRECSGQSTDDILKMSMIWRTGFLVTTAMDIRAQHGWELLGGCFYVCLEMSLPLRACSCSPSRWLLT